MESLCTWTCIWIFLGQRKCSRTIVLWSVPKPWPKNSYQFDARRFNGRSLSVTIRTMTQDTVFCAFAYLAPCTYLDQLMVKCIRRPSETFCIHLWFWYPGRFCLVFCVHRVKFQYNFFPWICKRFALYFENARNEFFSKEKNWRS